MTYAFSRMDGQNTPALMFARAEIWGARAFMNIGRVRLRRFWRRLALASLVLICGLAALPRAAQAQPVQRSEQRLIDSLVTQLERVGEGPMELRLGFGPVLTVPDSGKAKFHAFVPLLSFRYHDWFVVEETQMRADIVSNDSALGQAGFHGGPMLKVDFGRKRLNDSDTQKLGQVSTALEVGAYAVYAYGPARLRIRARQDVADGHGGAIVEVDLRSGLFRSGNFGLGGGILATWTSRKYMQSFFGVTPVESLETHLPVFNAHAGFKDVSVGLSGEYKLSSHWSAIASAQYIHLLSDADMSPIPRTRGLGGRTNMGVFALYTFSPHS
jgi:outer membrane protein